MITLNDNTYAIRAIVNGSVDCEFGEVRVTVDTISALSRIKALYDEFNVVFVDEIDEKFKEIDFVNVSGRLNLPYDPDYFIRILLYFSEEKMFIQL